MYWSRSVYASPFYRGPIGGLEQFKNFRRKDVRLRRWKQDPEILGRFCQQRLYRVLRCWGGGDFSHSHGSGSFEESKNEIYAHGNPPRDASRCLRVNCTFCGSQPRSAKYPTKRHGKASHGSQLHQFQHPTWYNVPYPLLSTNPARVIIFNVIYIIKRRTVWYQRDSSNRLFFGL